MSASVSERLQGGIVPEEQLEETTHAGVADYVRRWHGSAVRPSSDAVHGEGIRICCWARFTTSIEGNTPVQCPLSTAILFDNDSMTSCETSIREDGLAKFDFTLESRPAPEGVPAPADLGMLSRLKLMTYASGYDAHPDFQFGVASGHFPAETLYEHNCRAHGAGGLSAEAQAAPTAALAVLRHNAAPVTVTVDIVPPPKGEPPLAVRPEDQRERFRKLQAQGAVSESILEHSPAVNDLIDAHAEFLQRRFEAVLQIDTPRGVNTFANMGSVLPMAGERLLYPDIGKRVTALPYVRAPEVACLYAIGMGFNLNGVRPSQARKLKPLHLAHILADCFTFYTLDSKAAGYISDVTFVALKNRRSAPSVAGNRWQGEMATGPTESMTRPFSKPNCDGVVFASNDCEDYQAATAGVVMGFKVCEEKRRRDPEAFRKHFDNRLFSAVPEEDREGILFALQQAYEMSRPFRARVAATAAVLRTGSVMDPAASHAEMGKALAAPTEIEVDCFPVLGTALAAQAGAVADRKMRGVFGGHAYYAMTIKTADKPAQCLTLEGTAYLHNVESDSREQYVHLKVQAPVGEVAEMQREGFRLLATRPDGVAELELAMPLDDYLNHMRAAPCLRTSSTQTRKQIAICSLSKLTARRQAPTTPAEFGEHLRQDAELQSKAQSSFYQDALAIGDRVPVDSRRDPAVLAVGLQGCAAVPGLAGEANASAPWLGTFYPLFAPGKPDVELVDIQNIGLHPRDAQTTAQYKLARLAEVSPPVDLPRFEREIIETWKPLTIAACDRGDSVNEYLESVHCITVGEAATEPSRQKALDASAHAIASETNAQMARSAMPHEMRDWAGIHSSFRTLVLHRETATKEAVRGHRRQASETRATQGGLSP